MEPHPIPRVTVELEAPADGQPGRFVLRLGAECATLEPGRTWIQVDHYKWAMRGLVEEPQSFAIHADGGVSLNGEVFSPADPAQASLLEAALNKRHVASPAPGRPSRSRSRSGVDAGREGEARDPRGEPGSSRVRFRVVLDPLGHLLVQARRGAEATETGLRGLDHLMAEGWMLRPGRFHLDPLQRHLEIDGVRIECTAEGARALEALLNERYAAEYAAGAGAGIEIRENPAAATGFDIHFQIVRAGTRFEIKGHLGQDKLDILQDHEKCDLLRPGVVLRLSPPFLYLRRRRADGGEEPIPGMPDIKYRGITAAEFQRLLNHPALRDRPPDGEALVSEPGPARALVEAPVVAPVVAPRFTAEAEGRASTVSKPGLETASPGIAGGSAGEGAGRREGSETASTVRVGAGGAGRSGVGASSKANTTAAGGAEGSEEEAGPMAGRFLEREPQVVHPGILQALSGHLGVGVREYRFSLPRVFEDRRFEVLSLGGEAEIPGVMYLRSAAFHGFYLTHPGAGRSDLVYACCGVHLEWGSDKCTYLSGPGAETMEIRGAGLVGWGKAAGGGWVAVVTRRYREWIRPHDRECASVGLGWLTPESGASEWVGVRVWWPASNRVDGLAVANL